MPLPDFVIKESVKFALKMLGKKLFSEKTLKDDVIRKSEVALSQHLNFISNWSSRIQFYGLGSPKNTDGESISLKMLPFQRRFKSENDGDRNIDESYFLQSGDNYLLMGAPGSGKTTTLKRLGREILFEDGQDPYSFPILIRLKEITPTVYKNIYVKIAEIFGLEITSKETSKEVEKVIRISEKIEGTKHKSDFKKDEKGNIVKKTISTYQYSKEDFIEEMPIKTFIIKYLNEAKMVLLIDGLDELENSLSESFERDIEELALNLMSSKIVMTCRSGYYNHTIEGFNVLEILPLDESQIRNIASIWVENLNDFFENLKKYSYKDMVDRPLFLSQLLFIFQRFGSLPGQPADVYKLIIELLLKDWDADRKVIRKSRYADFGARKKAEFLSELSYHLTIKEKIKQFSTSDLVRIYENICHSFGLPVEEAEKVACEVETHTGIIEKASLFSYEFSHLSLQEYLCADYIVRAPLTNEILYMVSQYPDPVAISVSLSSDSSAWFSNFVLATKYYNKGRKNLGAFLSRLVAECPIFKVSKLFGFTVLALTLKNLKLSKSTFQNISGKFSRLEAVHKSIKSYLNDTNYTEITKYGSNMETTRVTLKNPDAYYSKDLIQLIFDFSSGELAQIKEVLNIRF